MIANTPFLEERFQGMDTMSMANRSIGRKSWILLQQMTLVSDRPKGGKEMQDLTITSDQKTPF